jgi:nitrate reductase alpha subunit
MNNRTYPRASSYEQQKGEQPWHTKSGRLEFYRFEPEFIEAGENLVVYREPVDSTFHEPNVILGKKHPACGPKQPEDYGLSLDVSTETRQVRNVHDDRPTRSSSKHPLHGARGSRTSITRPSTATARTRRPSTPTSPVCSSARSATCTGTTSACPRSPRGTSTSTRPTPGRSASTTATTSTSTPIPRTGRSAARSRAPRNTRSRACCFGCASTRARPGTSPARGTTCTARRSAASKGHETRADGLAKNPETNYQAMYRYGSHQSATRAWLKPTLMTETLVHKDMFGQMMMRRASCPTSTARWARRAKRS